MHQRASSSPVCVLCVPRLLAASVSSLMLYFQGAQTFLVSDLRDRFHFEPAHISAVFVSLILW